MEKETSSLVSLGIVLIAIAVVITLGFGIFAVGKRLANNGQNDLVSQVDQVNKSTFIDLDQQVITGTRLKGVINQLSSGNYAILLNTLALRNNQADGAKLTGDLKTNPQSYTLVKTNILGSSSKGTEINNTIFVNYNAILKNSAAFKTCNVLKDENTQIWKITPPDNREVAATNKIDLYGMSTDGTDTDGPDKGALLTIKDGVFVTELEFMTSPDSSNSGGIVKNTRIMDFTKQGTTMYIADAAQFNSLCIKDSTDNYVGIAFMQIQR